MRGSVPVQQLPQTPQHRMPRAGAACPGTACAGLLRGALLLGAVLLAVPASGEGPGDTSRPPRGESGDVPSGEEAATPRVELDRLLRLPDSMDYRMEERGGATADEWRGRFLRLRQAVVAAEARVADAQRALEEEASSESAWKVAPPGIGPLAGAAQQSGGASQGPGNYQLSQALRRAKEDLERAERALRSLIVEANLAGVPEAWRE